MARPETACVECARLQERIADLEARLGRYEGLPAHGDLVALTRLSVGVVVGGARKSFTYLPGSIVPPAHVDGLAEGVHYRRQP